MPNDNLIVNKVPIYECRLTDGATSTRQAGTRACVRSVASMGARACAFIGFGIEIVGQGVGVHSVPRRVRVLRGRLCLEEMIKLQYRDGAVWDLSRQGLGALPHR